LVSLLVRSAVLCVAMGAVQAHDVVVHEVVQDPRLDLKALRELDRRRQLRPDHLDGPHDPR